jgi:hypothetical protein
MSSAADVAEMNMLVLTHAQQCIRCKAENVAPAYQVDSFMPVDDLMDLDSLPPHTQENAEALADKIEADLGAAARFLKVLKTRPMTEDELARATLPSTAGEPSAPTRPPKVRVMPVVEGHDFELEPSDDSIAALQHAVATARQREDVDQAADFDPLRAQQRLVELFLGLEAGISAKDWLDVAALAMRGYEAVKHGELWRRHGGNG